MNGKEVPIETTPHEVLALRGVEAPSHLSDEELPPKEVTHTRPLQITIECVGAKVPIVLIDKGVVSESGTHTELMRHNGLYRKLNEMQFEFGVVTQSPEVEQLEE